MSLGQTINVRGRIPLLASPDAAAGYIHNGLVYGTARFRYEPSMPLGEIARRNRAAVSSVIGDQALTDVLFAVQREQGRRGQSFHICEMFETSYHMTNWAPAWRELDFAPALEAGVKEARGGRNLKLMVFGEGQPSDSIMRCKNRLYS